jgi:monoamine oxidase
VGADYDVVIVGAGIAGMTAARLLSDAGPGLKVIVLEAQDRVGGRLHTLYGADRGLPTHGIEVGAQLIHGSGAATWELIREFGLETRSRGKTLQALPLRPAVEERVPSPEVVDPLMASIARAYSSHTGGDIPFSEFMDTLWLDDAERELVYSEPLSWSAEPDRISTRAVIQDGAAWSAYHDEDFQLVGGHSALAEKLASDLQGRIQLNSEVTEVFLSANLAGVGYRYGGVDTTLSCRQLVLTLPVGVLKSGRIKVTPALPADVGQALDALEMGQVVVVPMVFSEPFWSETLTGPGEWTSPAGRQQFWIPHAPGEGGHAVQGWFQGSAARELSELGPEAGLARVLRWLEEASGETGLTDKLVWHHFEDWVSNPYTLGSYSITRPGGHGLRQRLAEPIGGTLYLAGEATAPAPHYQTVHGAYMSGKRAAGQVMARLKMGDAPTDESDAPLLELL